MGTIIIYGKTTCPHTKRALAAYPEARFVDVLASSANLDEMLQYSGGKKKIPVIVLNGQATIGYNRGS
ncbi:MULTISPECIES: UXX-star (seleno)protein family 1 [unclassified Pseudodesulfovibrio]|uniref:UXX-star selenoprotein family 1 n=1 Tax=unclassified Pseudodesulfovibrio TaxID=2661612 RepID=UPI000FEC177B|nr:MULTISPECIES: UXX-star (seleno)protein family 1 [unclassified Pseudodesulfovibrio]MCJ2163167.1 glutaredoxin [Pseudodesulfovibrio sp. S3-i]RWU07156.1 glutaredoxin [Pseudodesulfovibrio sp. S3]